MRRRAQKKERKSEKERTKGSRKEKEKREKIKTELQGPFLSGGGYNQFRITLKFLYTGFTARKESR